MYRASALSSGQLSPNGERENWTPLLPGCFPTSPIPPGPDSPPPEATGSFDSLLAYVLLGQTTDVACVSATREAACLGCIFPAGLVPGGTLRRVHHAV